MRFLTFVLLIPAMGLVGCNKGGGTQEITETREVAAPQETAASSDSTSSADRFGFQPSSAAPAAQAGPQYSYEKPEGWTEKAPTQFRLANFAAGPNGEVEVFVSEAGGGLAGNINRWRKQVGQPDLTEQEIAALPKVPALGKEGVLVDFTGTYAGMQGGGAPKENYRLAGVLVELDGGQVATIKLVGPADVAAAELDKLKQFAASLKKNPGGGAMMAGNPHAGVPGMDAGGDPHAGVPGMGAAGGDPHAGVPGMGAAGGMMGGMQGASDTNLEWTAPAGWEKAEDRPMRVVTFKAGEGTEVYVSVLSGAAGGAMANINRWRNQMGVKEVMTQEQVAALPKVTVLGQPAPLVQIEGSFTGMSGETQSNAMLLGTVVEQPDQSLFIKMTGPAATVTDQKDEFVSFVESLKVKQQ